MISKLIVSPGNASEVGMIATFNLLSAATGMVKLRMSRKPYNIRTIFFISLISCFGLGISNDFIKIITDKVMQGTGVEQPVSSQRPIVVAEIPFP
jgi:hypothetical protein